MDEVERLKKYVESHQEALRIDRDRMKPKPNENMDADIPDFMPSYGFWCDVCCEDFNGPARKIQYTLEGNRIAVIRGLCPECGTQAIRYATHRDQDPYYQKSRSVRRERNINYIDLLQEGDFGFRTYYKNAGRIDEKKIHREEMGIIMGEQHDTGLKGLSLEAQEKLWRLKNLQI